MATITDISGNATVLDKDVAVIDPTDVDAPVVVLMAPDAGLTLTELTNIIGSIADPDDNLTGWTLTLSCAGGYFRHIASGTAEVTAGGGILGQLDPTTLANGLYKLTLTATDAGGNVGTATRSVQVDGLLKLGQFSLSFVDLQLPVSGIPITVTRTYNTLTAHQQGDFGYGWSLDFSNTSIEVNHATSGLSGFGDYKPFRDGTRVVVTLPDGTTQGFTFYGAPATNPIIGNEFVPAAWIEANVISTQYCGLVHRLCAADDPRDDRKRNI